MAKILKTSREGRKCITPGCHHLLSIYNHQKHCRIHQEQMSVEEKEELKKTPLK
jgi:hypothetical protein